MNRHAIAAWIITGTLLIAVLPLRLLPALLAGLLVYELVHVIEALASILPPRVGRYRFTGGRFQVRHVSHHRTWCGRRPSRRAMPAT